MSFAPPDTQSQSNVRTFNAASPQPEAFTPILTVPGLFGSPWEHWQSVWERERSDCARIELGMWDDPSPEVWLRRLDDSVRSLPRPGVLVAHSLGCLATAMWLTRNRDVATRKILGALFVAPCDPMCGRSQTKLQRFTVPRVPIPVRSTVVVSANDPYATLAWSAHVAADWGAELIKLENAGHINADSGLGEWSFGQALLETILSDVSERTTGTRPC